MLALPDSQGQAMSGFRFDSVSIAGGPSVSSIWLTCERCSKPSSDLNHYEGHGLLCYRCSTDTVMVRDRKYSLPRGRPYPFTQETLDLLASLPQAPDDDYEGT